MGRFTDEAAEKIWRSLEDAADLDGLITESQREIGARVEISQTHTSQIIRSFIEEGLLVEIGRTTGNKSSRMMLQIVDY